MSSRRSASSRAIAPAWIASSTVAKSLAHRRRHQGGHFGAAARRRLRTISCRRSTGRATGPYSPTSAPTGERRQPERVAEIGGATLGSIQLAQDRVRDLRPAAAGQYSPRLGQPLLPDRRGDALAVRVGAKRRHVEIEVLADLREDRGRLPEGGLPDGIESPRHVHDAIFAGFGPLCIVFREFPAPRPSELAPGAASRGSSPTPRSRELAAEPGVRAGRPVGWGDLAPPHDATRKVITRVYLPMVKGNGLWLTYYVDTGLVRKARAVAVYVFGDPDIDVTNDPRGPE